MKKFLTLSVVILIFLLSLAAFARTVITDGDLDEITAEQGVSIDFFNVTVGGNTNTKLQSVSWGDTTGFTGYTNPGYFGLSNVTITGNLLSANGGNNKPMTIDIGNSGTNTKVFIVVPTGMMTLGPATITAYLVAATNSGLSSNISQGGILSLNGFSTMVSGTVAVYAHE